MMKKTTFTAACMLMAVGCTELQTKKTETTDMGGRKKETGTYSGKNNNEEIIIEIKANNKENRPSYSKQKENGTSGSNVAYEQPKNESLDEKIDNLRVTRLFDENKMVDRSMPNSQLVLQKLSELKRKHQEILKNGTLSQKKTVALQTQLLKSYSNWKGTKYQLGGDSQNGMDCSALTRRIYREVYGYELPRRTVQQVKVGAHVTRGNLKPGDIVFFKPDGKHDHTAVYLGDTLFINASSSKGVVLSTLENSYWGRYFRYGVRIRSV